jgi:hypothetical protein
MGWMPRLILLALIVTAALAAVPAAPADATGQAPTGWNGVNPYQCVLQHAGLNETGPDPKADPYCVDFDKRQQNVTQLGFAQFLLKEPGRVAAAADKCFYFQSDHWRGSIIQDDGSTKTYEFDGHYFTNQATGDGGVWITNFNVNGKTFDPSEIPGIPQQYAQYLGPGTGGVITRNDVPANPACAERLRRDADHIYATSTAAGSATPARACLVATGSIGTRAIGPIALGYSEAATRNAIGAPVQVKRGFLRYCLKGGGSFLVGEDTDRSGESGGGETAHAVMVVTSGATQKTHRVGPGSTLSSLRKAFRASARRLTIRHTSFYAPSARSGMLFAVRGGRVRWVAVYDRAKLKRASTLRAYLIRSRGL